MATSASSDIHRGARATMTKSSAFYMSEAEKALARIGNAEDGESRDYWVARAQVLATLAVAAANREISSRQTR